MHKIRHLFTVKAYFVPFAGLAFFIWAIVKAGGIGPIVHQPASIYGSELGWEFVKGVMSSKSLLVHFRDNNMPPTLTHVPTLVHFI